MLSEQEIQDVAHAAGKNPTQRNVAAAAIRKALEMADVTVTGQVPDSTAPLAAPTCPTVIFVASANEMTAAETKTVWPRLDKALALYGQVEVVTFGGLGAENIARKWSHTRGQAHREFAPAWAVPQGDGTTVRDAKAIATRNQNLRAYAAQVQQAFSLLFGDPTDRSYKRALAVHQLLEKAGANQQPKPDEPEPVEPSDTNAILALDAAMDEVAA